MAAIRFSRKLNISLAEAFDLACLERGQWVNFYS
jgi:hypothetical protein